MLDKPGFAAARQGGERAAARHAGFFSDTMGCMQTDELAEHLDALQREECYRVDAVLKESAFEITQRVMFVGRNGAEQGPFVRKYIKRDSGLGSVYARLREAQRYGRRFRFLPRVIDCYALGEDDVVVMEFVWGETLQDALYRCDPSVAFAADVFPRLCDAVLELHESFDSPIVHRDLKPTNIMISRDSLTIIDLGIARFFKDDADDDTRHFGTRAYTPPEQFGYGQTTVRSDVYALGMLLYFCLTEKTPDAHVRTKGFFDGRIPLPMRDVLMRATEFDPARRFSDVRALRDAFCAAARACGYGDVALAACASVPSTCVGGGVFGGRVVSCATGACAPFDGESPAFAPAASSGGGSCADGAPACPVVDPAGFSRVESRLSSVFGKGASALRGLRSACLAAKARIPNALIVAWNAAVVVCASLLLLGCMFAAFSPNEHDAAYPLWFRVLEFLVVGASNIVLLAYVLLDKRTIYDSHPNLARFSWWRQALFFVLYMLLTFGLLGTIAPAPGV